MNIDTQIKEQLIFLVLFTTGMCGGVAAAAALISCSLNPGHKRPSLAPKQVIFTLV
jgi:hypothetical protein